MLGVFIKVKGKRYYRCVQRPDSIEHAYYVVFKLVTEGSVPPKAIFVGEFEMDAWVESKRDPYELAFKRVWKVANHVKGLREIKKRRKPWTLLVSDCA